MAPRQDWFEMTEMSRQLRKMSKWKPTERLNPKRDAILIEFMALTGIPFNLFSTAMWITACSATEAWP